MVTASFEDNRLAVDSYQLPIFIFSIEVTVVYAHVWLLVGVELGQAVIAVVGEALYPPPVCAPKSNKVRSLGDEETVVKPFFYSACIRESHCTACYVLFVHPIHPTFH